jgi:transcriptional regulator with XRE-family HTH domain
MTQDELAAEVGTAGGVVSMIESGKRGLSGAWLRKFAAVLGISPGVLLDHDPNDIDAALVAAAMAVPKARRRQALEILKTFNTEAE